MTAIVKAESHALPSIEKARALLAECRSAGEVKQIRAVAQAVATLERGKEIAADAADIILWADRRIGELTRELPKAPDGQRRGSESGERTQKKVALSDLGISKQRASECERVAKLPEPDLRAYSAAKRSAKQVPTTSEAAKLARLDAPVRKQVLAKLSDVPSVAAAIREVVPTPPKSEPKREKQWDREAFFRDLTLHIWEQEDEWLLHEPNRSGLVAELRAIAALLEKKDGS